MLTAVGVLLIHLPSARLTDTGLVHLCSVFSNKSSSLAESAAYEAAAGPCGNTQTHVQVEGMVAAINELNGGKGFPVYAGSLEPTYLRLTYNWSTYPFGEWASTGAALSAERFAACDVVVGMANGCPDSEIVAQALIANATQRIYVTGRGPRQVLTQGGAYQPYLFSSHLRSDEYADAIPRSVPCTAPHVPPCDAHALPCARPGTAWRCHPPRPGDGRLGRVRRSVDRAVFERLVLRRRAVP